MGTLRIIDNTLKFILCLLNYLDSSLGFLEISTLKGNYVIRKEKLREEVYLYFFRNNGSLLA